MRISVVVALVILFLIIVGSKDLAIPLLYRYDPPSIYNPGSGGYSEFYSLVRREFPNIEVVFDLRDIVDYRSDRWLLIIASPDEPVDPRFSEVLARWIARGGIAVVLDEVGTVNSLLEYYGIAVSGIERDVRIVECRISNGSYSVVFNIYSIIRFIERRGFEYDVVCRYGIYPLGVSIRVGDGVLYVFSDSSLFINSNVGDIMELHLSLLRDISGDRGLLIFEGGRSYVYLHTRWLLSGLMLFIAVSKLMVDRVLASDLFIKTLIVSIVSLVFIAYYINPLSIERIVGLRRGGKLDIRDQIRSIERGVERWRRYLKKS